jgi:hypothetical protein
MSRTTVVSRNTLSPALSLKKKMTHKNLNSRCKAIAESGKPCRADAAEGGLCFFHANPDKASELGRIGGRGNATLPAKTVRRSGCRSDYTR